MSSIPAPLLWTVILGLAVGSYALRFAFIGFMGGKPIAPWLMRHLRYTAVAIIPALVAPLVVWPAPTDGAPSLMHFAAAAATLAVGYLTRNVLYGLGAGGVSLLLLYLAA
ncbi:AzlD domain-containing protein [Leisingera methylohalidivorans]|uniref:Membrane protein n=1 Tax=Leisingera methylohalidivorans DSM 14336 TaxID=999552 RepID=V9VQ74_9RHOB|nr:AzlD domain-containing protein [Leisingera methylohalidivorans]AHC99833.1 membrane protein [Leisingera methylohalidivorans DSM 14336]